LSSRFVVIILSRSEERRFIILLTEIFSILGYHMQVWRNKNAVADINEARRADEEESLQKELLSKSKIGLVRFY